MHRQFHIECPREPRTRRRATWRWALAGGLAAGLASCGGSPNETATSTTSGGGAALTTSSSSTGAGGSTSASASSTGEGSTSTGAGGTGGAGPTGCVPGKYLLCEDFESANDGAIPSGWTNDNGNATVASDQAFAGGHSLKISPSGYAHRIHTSAAALQSGHWGRIYYKVDLPVPSYGVHSTIVSLEGVGPKNGASEYRVVDTNKAPDGFHHFLYNVQTTTFEYGTGSPSSWKFDGAWHCAEWHIEAKTQSYHFYFDSAEVTEIALDSGAGNYDKTDIPTSFSQINIGWSNYQMPPNDYPANEPKEFTAWLDNFAANDSRIGCN